jgi:hypothetical protein
VTTPPPALFAKKIMDDSGVSSFVWRMNKRFVSGSGMRNVVISSNLESS